MPSKRTRAAAKQEIVENDHLGVPQADGAGPEEPPQLEREEGPTEDIVVTDEWGQVSVYENFLNKNGIDFPTFFKEEESTFKTKLISRILDSIFYP